MLKIFTGSDRMRAQQAAVSFLGADYEVIEGQDILPTDLPSIFRGSSLFSTNRHILIRDLTTNKAVFEKLPDYLDTPHDIAILEMKLDKRSATYKAIKSQAEIKEFTLAQPQNYTLIFNIYSTAKRDGKKALEMLSKVQQEQDPIMFLGLLVSQAIKDYKSHPGIKKKRALKELSLLDLQIKSTSFQPWALIQSFLLRLSSL